MVFTLDRLLDLDGLKRLVHMIGGELAEGVYFGGGTAFEGDGGHGDSADTAGDDGGEAGKVGGDVDGEAVHGDPLADADADGGDFSVFGPDSGEAFATGGGES